MKSQKLKLVKQETPRQKGLDFPCMQIMSNQTEQLESN